MTTKTIRHNYNKVIYAEAEGLLLDCRLINDKSPFKKWMCL